MVDLCQKRAGDVEDFEYKIGHTNIPQAADLEKACRKAFGKPPLAVFELGGVVSANTGPDTIALVSVGHPRGRCFPEAAAPRQLLYCTSGRKVQACR